MDREKKQNGTRDFLARFAESQVFDFISQKLTIPFISVLLSLINWIWGKRLELLASFVSGVQQMNIPDTAKLIISFLVTVTGTAILIYLVLSVPVWIIRIVLYKIRERSAKNKNSVWKAWNKSTDVLELIPADKVITSLGGSSSNGAGLRICNNSDFDVIECFGTLEDLRYVYIDDNKLLEDSNPSHLQLGLRVSDKLRWANKEPIDGECKKAIPARSKENILLVLNLVIETRVVKKGKQKEFAKDNQRYFNVPYCFPENENGIAPGLFKVRVRLNGKLVKSSEASSIIAYYEGYVYCYHKEAPFGIGTGLYWSQDPLNDQRIMNDEKLRKEYYDKET